MTIKEKFLAIKEMLKTEAKEISTSKVECKNKQRSGAYAGHEQGSLLNKRYEWRHKFIAYCQLKGRTLEEIEPKCRIGNEPDQNLVDKFKQEFTRDAE